MTKQTRKARTKQAATPVASKSKAHVESLSSRNQRSATVSKSSYSQAPKQVKRVKVTEEVSPNKSKKLRGNIQSVIEKRRSQMKSSFDSFGPSRVPNTLENEQSVEIVDTSTQERTQTTVNEKVPKLPASKAIKKAPKQKTAPTKSKVKAKTVPKRKSVPTQPGQKTPRSQDMEEEEKDEQIQSSRDQTIVKPKTRAEKSKPRNKGKRDTPQFGSKIKENSRKRKVEKDSANESDGDKDEVMEQELDAKLVKVAKIKQEDINMQQSKHTDQSNSFIASENQSENALRIMIIDEHSQHLRRVQSLNALLKLVNESNDQQTQKASAYFSHDLV